MKTTFIIKIKCTTHRMRYYALIILSTLLLSCHSTTTLKKSISVNELTVEFFKFNSNRTSQKGYTIHAKGSLGQKQTFYWFYESNDFVWKSEPLKQKANKDYYLVYDSSFNYSSDKHAKNFQDASEKINSKIFPLSPLDSLVINEVIQITDSLQLKNFHFLNKAIGFRLSAVASKN